MAGRNRSPSSSIYSTCGKLLKLHEEKDGATIENPLVDGYNDHHNHLWSHELIHEVEEAHPHSSKGVSFARSCFNATNALTGVGVLAMPYALSESGWLGLPLFILVITIFCYTAHLIQRCMDVDPSINSYPDIGQAAFGYRGKIAIATLMYLELYISAVGLLILEGDNLDKLFPNSSIEVLSLRIEGKQLFILVAALVVLPTTWLKNFGVLAYFSAAGVLSSFILFGSLLWTGVADTGFHANGHAFNLSGLPMALGLFAISFCGHAVFPTIYTSMNDPTKFSKVLITSFALGFLNCGMVALFGYLMYGDGVHSQVTLNLPDGKLYSAVAIYTTIFTPLTKYAWGIVPLAMAIEEYFALNGTGSDPNLLVRTLLSIGTVIIALAVPFFGYIMAFIGSFLGITASVLLPCMCYLKIFKSSMASRIEVASIISIILFGTIVAVFGTYSSVRGIVSSL